jgi:uncharacterized damage-inducible protein DinB
MSCQAHFQTLFAYHWHTTRRLIEAAARLDRADYEADPGYGRGSIHRLLFHLLNTSRNWRIGLETGRQPASQPAGAFPMLRSLQMVCEEERAAWQRLLERLDDEEIEGAITLVSRRGDVADIPRWRILQHMVLHGMQHHAEMAHLLTARGQSPGDIDFIFFD